jgi:hypothetical protein
MDAIAAWRYQTHPEFPNDHVVYLYLSGIYEPIFFEGEEAELLLRLLKASSHNIVLDSQPLTNK